MTKSIWIRIACIIFVFISIGACSGRKGPRVVELPGGGGKVKLKENQEIDSVLCENPIIINKEDGNKAYLLVENRKYEGDSLFIFLEECKGIPEKIARQYKKRFQLFAKGTVSSATTLSERYSIVLGLKHNFEMPPASERGYIDMIGNYTCCPICEFDGYDIGPNEANSFRDDFHWEEIIYFKKNNVGSKIANAYEGPLRARDIVMLANERPDIPVDFVNTCKYEKAENIIAVYDSGIPLEYANIAKPLIERYIGKREKTARPYYIEDLIKDHRNNVSVEDLKAKVKAEVKPFWNR